MSYLSLLNSTCTIQVKTKTQDATTGMILEAWANAFTSVKCRLDEAKGNMQYKVNDIYSKATHILFVEYRTDINENNHRVVIGSNIYTVLMVRDGGGQHHHTEIELEIIK